MVCEPQGKLTPDPGQPLGPSSNIQTVSAGSSNEKIMGSVEMI